MRYLDSGVTGRIEPATMAAGICAAALLLFPFLWPLHTKPLATFYNEWIAAVLLIAGCVPASLVALRRRAPAFELPAVAPLFVPLLAVVALQWALGRLSHSSDATLPLATLALATGALTYGRVLERQLGLERLLVWLSIAAVVGGLLNVLLQIAQVCVHSGIDLPFYRLDSRGQYYGALAQRNQLASYLAWGLTGVLYLYAARKLAARWTIVLTIVILVGMALTRSRTAWLEVGWITVAGVAYLRLCAATSRPPRGYLLLGLPLLFAAINLALPQILAALGLSFDRGALERIATEGVDKNRLLLYTQGLQLFLAHPLLGIGPGQLFGYQFQLLDQVDTTLYASSTHNIVLDLLVMTGLLGAVPFLLLCGTWVARALRQPVSAARAAIWIMLGTLCIHAMLELPHWYGFFLLPAAMLMGALDPGTLRLPAGRLLRALPLLLCAYGIAVAISMLFQYRTLESMHARYYSKERHQMIVDEKRLEEILAFSRTTWFTGPVDFILCTNFALNEIALPEKIAIAERTLRALPEPHIVYRYVLLLALDGRQEEGMKLLARTRKMFPLAYEEIASEFVQLGERQPEVFGQLANALKPAI